MPMPQILQFNKVNTWSHASNSAERAGENLDYHPFTTRSILIARDSNHV